MLLFWETWHSGNKDIWQTYSLTCCIMHYCYNWKGFWQMLLIITFNFYLRVILLVVCFRETQDNTSIHRRILNFSERLMMSLKAFGTISETQNYFKPGPRPWKVLKYRDQRNGDLVFDILIFTNIFHWVFHKLCICVFIFVFACCPLSINK